jgi:hypothetical protein
VGRAKLLRTARSLLALGAALSVLGCGSDNVAPVSGRVTLDGEPAANVRVTFQPLGSAENQNPGPGSFGITDTDGRYHLTVIGRKRPGAIVGKHRVSLKSSNAPPKPAKVIPKEYNAESTLEFDVPKEGTKTADFAVKTR